MTIRNFNENKNYFFDKINKINKPLDSPRRSENSKLEIKGKTLQLISHK